MDACKAEGCTQPIRANGLCHRHAEQMRRLGKLILGPSYKDPNEIQHEGDLCKIVLRNKTGETVGVAVVDACDLHLVKDYKWHLTNHGYVASKGKHGAVYMHRLLIGIDGGHIDHVDQDKQNNRRHNLRHCTASQNIANSKARKSSKTGIKGVHPTRNGFAAQITKDRKTLHLGTFQDADEAKASYDNKASEIFGGFARIE